MLSAFESVSRFDEQLLSIATASTATRKWRVPTGPFPSSPHRTSVIALTGRPYPYGAWVGWFHGDCSPAVTGCSVSSPYLPAAGGTYPHTP